MRRYTYFLKLKNENNKDKVLHELENYIFHSQLVLSNEQQTLWVKWHTENYSGSEPLERLKTNFLIDTWFEDN